MLKGIETLMLCSRPDNLSPNDTFEEAVAELRASGDEASRALAELIHDQLDSRTAGIAWSLVAARELDPTAELLEAVRSVLSASSLRKGAPGRFDPEILGDGRIGWTDGTNERIKQSANDALAELSSRTPGLRKIRDEEAVRPLLDALGDEDFLVRMDAAEGLGKLGDERAVRPLIDALGDEDELVRANVAEALGDIGHESAVEPLRKALGDVDEGVRSRAAWALGDIGDRRAVEPLIDALGDEHSWVRSAAAQALGGMGDGRAVEPLILALGDGAEEVSDASAKALERFEDEKARKALDEWKAAQ